MPNCDFIEAKCPLADYGCKFVAQRIDFSSSSSCSSHSHPVRLGFNNSTSTFVFSFDSNNSNSSNRDKDKDKDSSFKRKNYWDLDNGENGENLNLLDLPFEVLYEIITHLDSNSLFNLSITSKVTYFILLFDKIRTANQFFSTFLGDEENM
jgi:hypothetical protein